MAEYFIQTMGLPGWLTWSLLAVLSAVLILNLMAGGALVFIWAERKVSARIQDRLGPTRTGGWFGWLQSLADGIKLLAKEDLMPDPLYPSTHSPENTAASRYTTEINVFQHWNSVLFARMTNV